ncbi:MAG: flagellar hook protein FlgE [Smithella sp. PtaU1.Bin162]|nr:MAG: flagellar hook protein FlgE [Smithella sp. PtaU1.Bin162]
MPSAFGTALTALKAFTGKLDVNANNIANINTNDFKKSRVELQEDYSGGVEVTISKIETPGMEFDPDENTGAAQQSSNVNMEEEIADQMVAQYSYEANALIIKTAREIQKTLLDIMG